MGCRNQTVESLKASSGTRGFVDIAIMPEGSAFNPSMIVSATMSAERRSLKFNLLTFD